MKSFETELTVEDDENTMPNIKKGSIFPTIIPTLNRK